MLGTTENPLIQQLLHDMPLLLLVGLVQMKNLFRLVLVRGTSLLAVDLVLQGSQQAAGLGVGCAT